MMQKYRCREPQVFRAQTKNGNNGRCITRDYLSLVSVKVYVGCSDALGATSLTLCDEIASVSDDAEVDARISRKSSPTRESKDLNWLALAHIARTQMRLRKLYVEA